MACSKLLWCIGIWQIKIPVVVYINHCPPLLIPVCQGLNGYPGFGKYTAKACYLFHAHYFI